MFAGTVEDLKLFMSELLIRDTFDSWEVVEARAETFYELSINGRIKRSFFDDETEVPRDFVTWKEIKDVFYRMIRGKRLPGLFRLVLCKEMTETERILRECGHSECEGSRLLLNIRYGDGRCVLTSGVSHKSFTMDRSLEQTWEAELRQFMKQKGIAIQEQ